MTVKDETGSSGNERRNRDIWENEETQGDLLTRTLHPSLENTVISFPEEIALHKDRSTITLRCGRWISETNHSQDWWHRTHTPRGYGRTSYLHNWGLWESRAGLSSRSPPARDSQGRRLSWIYCGWQGAGLRVPTLHKGLQSLKILSTPKEGAAGCPVCFLGCGAQGEGGGVRLKSCPQSYINKRDSLFINSLHFKNALLELIILTYPSLKKAMDFPWGSRSRAPSSSDVSVTAAQSHHLHLRITVLLSSATSERSGWCWASHRVTQRVLWFALLCSFCEVCPCGSVGRRAPHLHGQAEVHLGPHGICSHATVQDWIRPSCTITLVIVPNNNEETIRLCLWGTCVKFLLSKHIGGDLLNLEMCASWALIDTANSFPKWFNYVHTLHKRVTSDPTLTHIWNILPS